MNVMRLGGVLGATLIAGLACAGAEAAYYGHGYYGRPYYRGHSSVGVGVVIGAPLGWGYYPGWYSYAPAYSYPSTVVIESSPPVYVERGPAGQSGGDSWYYCRKSRAYYPYVKNCPAGWERVAPRPED